MLRRRAVVYAAAIAASIAAIAALIRVGERWFGAPGPYVVMPGAGTGSGDASLAILITQLLVVVLATQLVGALATLFRQPFVVGEIAAGLMLGPSLLGHLWPEAYQYCSCGGLARHAPAPEPGRRHPLHVHGGPRSRSEAPPASGVDRDRRQPLQHRRSVPPGRGRRAGALHALRATGRPIPCVRALHGDRAQHHGLSCSRARPRRPRPRPDAPRIDCHRMRRRRRRDRMVAAGGGRHPGDGGRRGRRAGSHRRHAAPLRRRDGAGRAAHAVAPVRPPGRADPQWHGNRAADAARIGARDGSASGSTRSSAHSLPA